MSIIDWINRRLPGDQARHSAVCLVVCTLAAHATFLAPWIPEPWMRCILAALLVCLLEPWQHYTGRGIGSWNDAAANLVTGALVAIATTA
jgi:hypothetical protein